MIVWSPPASCYLCASIPRRLRAIQEIAPAQPDQGLGPVDPPDVFQEIEDAAPHARLMVAPRAGTVAGDVDGQGALAPIAPLSGRRAAGRLPQQLKRHGLQQVRPVRHLLRSLSCT